MRQLFLPVLVCLVLVLCLEGQAGAGSWRHVGKLAPPEASSGLLRWLNRHPVPRLVVLTLSTPTCFGCPGDRRLLIKYRPAKKAAIHLRALGLVDEDGAPTEDRCPGWRSAPAARPAGIASCTGPAPRKSCLLWHLDPVHLPCTQHVQ